MRLYYDVIINMSVVYIWNGRHKQNQETVRWAYESPIWVNL